MKIRKKIINVNLLFKMRVKSILIATIIFGLVGSFFVGCEKDSESDRYLEDTQNIQLNGKKLNAETILLKRIDKTNQFKDSWSKKESEFFDLDREIVLRSSSKLHPLTLEVRNQIANENSNNNFVYSLYSKLGIPLWRESIVLTNSLNRTEFIAIPFKYAGRDGISGILTASRDGEDSNDLSVRDVSSINDDFSITAMSRSQVLNFNSYNPKVHLNALQMISNFEKSIYNKSEVSDDITTAICDFLSNPKDEKYKTSFDCEWQIREICYSVDDKNLPDDIRDLFDGDDDNDGIRNGEDPDFWIDHPDPDLVEYYYYFDDQDHDGINNYNDQDFDFDWFFDFFDNMGDFMGDLWRDIWDTITDWWDDVTRPDIDCPWANDDRGDWDDYYDDYGDYGLSSNSSFTKGNKSDSGKQKLEYRDGKTVCLHFHVLVCDGEWWIKVLCDECGNDMQDDREFIEKRLKDFIEENRISCSDDELFLIGEDAGCDVLDPNQDSYNACLLTAYEDDYRSDISDFIEHERIESASVDDFVNATDDTRMYECSCIFDEGEFSNCLVKHYLDKKFNTDIAEQSIRIIDGVMSGTSSDGVLHMDLPVVDMFTADEADIVDHFIFVLKEASKYHCENEGEYEPIDWNEYFANCSAGDWTGSWNGCEPVAVSFSDFYSSNQDYKITHTEPAVNSSAGGGIWKFGYLIVETNFIGLEITMPEGCSSDYQRDVHAPCE